MYARALRALVRDTFSPDVVHAGVKYNVIPGDATVEIDCRLLPGTTEPDIRAELLAPPGTGARGGLRARAHLVRRRRSSRPPTARCSSCSATSSATTTRTPIPLPVMVPFATDAKHTGPLGVPTYGFSPLRLDPDERFLERFHGVDERVSVDALRWGLPVLYDVVRRFCG